MATTDRMTSTTGTAGPPPRNSLFSALIGLATLAIFFQSVWAGMIIREGKPSPCTSPSASPSSPWRSGCRCGPPAASEPQPAPIRHRRVRFARSALHVPGFVADRHDVAMARRRVVVVVGLLAALAVGVDRFPTQSVSVSNTPASTANSPTDPASADLAAPAQSALDRILGPDHALVTAYATYAQPSKQSSLTHGSTSVVVSQSNVSQPGYQASVVNNGVDVTLTDSRPGAPQITRVMVAVVVDSALRPTPNLAIVRRTVSAALGLQVKRGDRISVAAMPMAAPSAVATATNHRSPWRDYMQTVVAAVTAAVLGLVLLLDILLARRRRQVRDRMGARLAGQAG